MPHSRASLGQGGSGILPLIHAGQAAGSRFHLHSAFMEGGSGILPLDLIQPEPRRLCHVAAGLGHPALGVNLGTSAHETPDAASLALGLWARVFVYFVYFVVPKTLRCGPVACGGEVVACCLG